MATEDEKWKMAWHWLVSHPDLDSADPTNPFLRHAEFDTWKAEVESSGSKIILDTVDDEDRLKNSLKRETRLIEAVDEWRTE